MPYEIFKSIEHRRVVGQNSGMDELFDLYQFGSFKNGLNEENVDLVELQPSSKYRLHFHKKSAAVIYIISGTGVFYLAESCINYKAGIRIEVPTNTLHGFTTKTRTLFLSIQCPSIIDSNSGDIDLYYADGDYHNAN